MYSLMYVYSLMCVLSSTALLAVTRSFLLQLHPVFLLVIQMLFECYSFWVLLSFGMLWVLSPGTLWAECTVDADA